MQHILETLNLKEYDKITIDDMMIVMLKVKAISNWNQGCDIWNKIENTITRFVITSKWNFNPDEFEKQIGILHPIIIAIEEFYNKNAPEYEPDFTAVQDRNHLMCGYLTDMMCKIQTMQQEGWDYHDDETKKSMFDACDSILDAYLDIIEDDDNFELPEKIYVQIEMLNKMVNKEFMVFWNEKYADK